MKQKTIFIRVDVAEKEETHLSEPRSLKDLVSSLIS
jgi:hypothetical protein